MGFEDMDELTPKKDEEQGFETSGIELEDGLVAQARPVRPSRRKKQDQPEVKSGIKTEEEGAAPAPRKIMYTPSHAHPRVMKENSEFGYLFSDDEPEDTHMSSAFAGRLDGLAYDEKQDGEGEKYDELFAQSQNESMVKKGFTARSKKDKTESEESRPPEQQSESRSLFSRHGRKNKKKEETDMEGSEIKEVEQSSDEDASEDEVAVPATPYPYPQPQYPYPQPYPQYPQYPYQQQPYPPQYPYAQPYPPQYPYGQPYPQYPQYPYQQPYPYPPQQVYPVMQPIGYIYQPGAVQPAVLPQPHRRKSATARSNARRYGQLPYEDQIPADAKQDEQPRIPEPQPEPQPAVQEPAQPPVTFDPYPPAKDEEKAEPQPIVEPIETAPAEPEPAPAPTEGGSRFNRRSRSNAPAAAPASAPEPAPEQSASPAASDGGDAKPKFNRRSRG